MNNKELARRLNHQAINVENSGHLNAARYMREAAWRLETDLVQECLEEIRNQVGGGRELEDGSHSPDWDAALECVDAMIRHRFGLKREILDTCAPNGNKPSGAVTYTIEKGAD